MGQDTSKTEKGSITKEEVTMDATENRIEAVVDLEEYARTGKTPPKSSRYIIRIDKVKYEVIATALSGRQLLELAQKTPVEKYLLTQKLAGGVAKKVDFEELVDFTTPGIERFMTLPLDQQEG